MYEDITLSVREDSKFRTYDVMVNCEEYCILSVQVPIIDYFSPDVSDAFAVEALANQFKSSLHSSLRKIKSQLDV